MTEKGRNIQSRSFFVFLVDVDEEAHCPTNFVRVSSTQNPDARYRYVVRIFQVRQIHVQRVGPFQSRDHISPSESMYVPFVVDLC